VTLFSAPQLDAIADALTSCGYVVADNFLPPLLLYELLKQFNHLQETAFKAAGIGRHSDFHLQDQIRTDKIHWLEANTATSTLFLQCMDALRMGLNRRLFMGLAAYEGHFAHYPVGAFYKKHLDVFREKNVQNAPVRRLSTVLYLNENWQACEGGQLSLYDESGENRIENIMPAFGRYVIFLSDKFPHEVLPATRERKSIAGWFSVNSK
jgi:SM-20-related protein